MTNTWLDLNRPLDPRLDRLLRDLDDRLRTVVNEALHPESKRRMLDYFLRARSVQESDERLAAASQLLEAFEAGWRS